MLNSHWIFLFYLLLLHFKFITLSIYVHRGLSHNLFTFSQPLHHFFRFGLWITGFAWPKWVQHYCAMHRKHHNHSDDPDDPHSPFQLTFSQMFDYRHNEPGRPNYISPEDKEKYCPIDLTPNDWMQRNIYDPYQSQGIWVLYLIGLILFGPVIGILCIPVTYFVCSDFFVFITNWNLHKIGYSKENFKSDKSKNIFPIGILMCGEELHNNHHNQPWNPNFGQAWYEFDIGYFYIRILSFFGLLKINSKK